MNNSFQEVLAEMVGTNAPTARTDLKAPPMTRPTRNLWRRATRRTQMSRDEEPPRKMGGSEVENPSEEADVVTVTLDGEEAYLKHGSAVIAAITSCTTHLQPVSHDRGRVCWRRRPVEKGLTVDPHVKTSLAPGSKVVYRIPRSFRASAVPRAAKVQRRRLRLYDVHRQLRAAAGRGLRSRRGRTSWSWPPCFRATGTSRAASTRT